MQPARMAQIRRDPASEVVSVCPRRDFRPTGSWVPFRPFAVSPIRPLAHICASRETALIDAAAIDGRTNLLNLIMKLLRYGPKGQEKPGLLDNDGKIRDLSGAITDIVGPALSEESLATLGALDLAALPVVPGEPRIGACVGSVGKFIGIGLNYADHAAETGAAIPKEPVVFSKWVTCVSGCNDDIQIPPGSSKTDWEVELGVVIGKTARRVSETEALNYVAGYCVVNDVSEREYQIERGPTWDKGKGFDSFGPIGPWLVTKDEVPDPQNLQLWLEVDGVRRQSGTTKTMVFSVATLVSYLSQIMTLNPGDVIATGTPPGVGMGMKPPVYLRPGQVVRLGVDRLGEQRQQTVQA